ncbi:winged helix-turn-helix domain-containing protein [Alloactinosynnema sp. L-07]|uniref:winged helix-turn-helix domain-containing protein n=1 Tax=Alloactinosynnema sp. L-07 TaxID=1653480 RepID=UPI001E60D9A7|nr:winged helix-turn-helix domain-containing protein [Alloactinosynnema sp. L-07]
MLCVGTSAEQLAAVAEATAGGVAVVYLPDDAALRAVIEGVGSVAVSAHRVIEVGKLRLDADLREATWHGEVMTLSSRDFDLLYALAGDPGRVWAFSELTTHVWGRPYVGDTQAVVSAVKRLRRSLRCAAPGVQVESVRSVGYRVTVAEVPIPSH